MVCASRCPSCLVFSCSDPTLGLVDASARVAPLIQTTSSDPSLERHFSSFALTSHLHSPVLRLVSLHPSLSVTISFLRVPEIHDGFTWRCFFSRAATVADVSQSILDTLGLTRSLPGPGGGTVLYVLEDVWAESDVESELRPPFFIPSLIFSQRLPHSLQTHASPNCYFLP
jgi:diaphanous 1